MLAAGVKTERRSGRDDRGGARSPGCNGRRGRSFGGDGTEGKRSRIEATGVDSWRRR